MAEVRGSIPLGSTSKASASAGAFSVSPPRRGVLRLVGVVAVVVGAVGGLAAWQLSGSTHPAAKPPAIGPQDAAAALPRAKPAAKPPPAPAAKARPVYAVLNAARGRSWV